MRSPRAVVRGRQARLRAAALADRLAERMTVPYPFSPEAYQTVLSDVVGAPIRLLPFSEAIHSTVSSLTGMTLPLNRTVYIFYRSDTSPIHQLHGYPATGTLSSTTGSARNPRIRVLLR